MPLHVSSTTAHRQEAKSVLYSLWYHHTYRWPSRAHIEMYGQQNSKNCALSWLITKISIFAVVLLTF